jgi:YHS domain-containing protein
MQGLFSLLLFAAFFYFMMRFGCGAHMVHGSHGGHGGHGDPAGSAKDLVCGMDVAPGEGYAKMYQGRQYRFCSRKCLDQFEAEPKRYVATTGGM